MVSMFIPGVKLLLKLLILPIAMAAIAYGLYEFGNYEPLMAAQLSIAVVGFLALMWVWVLLSLQKAQIEQVRQGIHDHESSIVKRINSISANMANGKAVEKLERQFDYIQKNINAPAEDSQVIDAGDAVAIQDHSPHFEDSEASEDAKVISLASAKRSLEKQTKIENLYPEPKDVSDLISKGNICIYLQPKVTLLDNAVCGFEVLARLKDNNGRMIPAVQFIKSITKPSIMQKIDAEVLDQTINLMRSLRRKGQKPLMHVNLSIHSFSNKDAFDNLIGKLSSNKSLKKLLVLEVSEEVFMTIISKHSKRISEIMQVGFRFCLDNCQDAVNATKFMKNGMISSIKINANTFQEIDYWASINSEINLAAQATENGVSLIATHVEKKRQVIQLIDNNVEIAQGFLFSDPKPPASKATSRKSSDAGTKVAQR